MQTILIVDDEEEWRQTLRDIVEDMGYEALLASSLSEAKIHLEGRWISVALVDVNLDSQGFDGPGGQVFYLLHDTYPSIPVIAVTGKRNEDTDLRRLFAECGIRDYIKKHEMNSNHFRDLIRRSVETHPGSSTTLTWLHLSDLHFRDLHNFDENIVLTSLLKDVGLQTENELLRPDFVVVSGDIAFSGKDSQYELASEFLDSLLNVTGLTPASLFVVPGNHDVDRDQISDSIRIISGQLNTRKQMNTVLADPVLWGQVVKRFGSYAKFVNRYLKGYQSFDDEHYFSVRTLEVKGYKIAILSLNSASLCASDSDERDRLVLGELQVRSALSQAEGSTLRIAVLHHPFDLLRTFDRGISEPLLMDNCDFILHGHLHSVAMAQLVNPDGAATVLTGGACYETIEYPNSYNFVRLNLSTGKGEVFLRRYTNARGGFWARDTMTYRNAPNGVWTFNSHISIAT